MAEGGSTVGELARLATYHLDILDAAAFWKANSVAGYDSRHFEAALTRLGRDFCRRERCAEAPLPHALPRAIRPSRNGTTGCVIPCDAVTMMLNEGGRRRLRRPTRPQPKGFGTKVP